MRQSSLSRPFIINITVVGDSTVGKSTIIYNYKNDSPIENNIPKKLENTKIIEHRYHNKVELNIVDTIQDDKPVNQIDIPQIRPDIFLLVFSVVDKYSFNNIITKWIPLLDKGDENNQKPTLILIGNKIDLRQGKNSNHLTKKQVEKTLKKNKINLQYQECSAVTQKGLKEIFSTVIWYELERQGYYIESYEEQVQNGKIFVCCQIS